MSYLPVNHAEKFTVTSVTAPGPDFTAIYTGTFPNGAGNGLSGYTFTIAGFTNAGNNILGICIASTATTIQLYPAFAGGAETHAATATTSAFLGLGFSTDAGSAGFPSVPINTPNRAMIAVGSPLYVSPGGLTEQAGFAYTTTWKSQTDGNEDPFFSGRVMSPTDDPAFPFAVGYEGWLTSDPNYTGDSSGCFIDVLDINTSLRSPAHFGQVYGMLLEHGCALDNGLAIHVDDMRRLYAESLHGNGPGTNAVYNFGRHVGYNNATGGFYGPQNGIIGTSWAMNFEGPRLGGGNAVYNSHMGIRMASQQQGAVQGTFTLSAVANFVANQTLSLTSVASASSGLTVYTGTITGGASNAYTGYYFVITGFLNAANNGTFFCVSSSATTLTLVYAGGVAETHAATAVLNTSDYTGTFPNAGGNAYAGQVFVVAGFTATGSALSLTAAGNATSSPGSLPGMTKYTGTVTGGDANNYLGRTFTVAGFLTGGNNGTFFCYASTATSLTLGNPNGTAETHAATATPNVNNGIFRCKASTTTTLTLGNYLGASETHAATAVSRNGNAWGIHQDDGGEKNAFGMIYIGGESGPLLSTGSLTPEGNTTSVQGGYYFRSNGLVYAKVSGSGNTGWTPVNPGIRTAVATDSATNDDGTILCNGTFTETLPTTGIYPRKKFVIKNVGTGVITVSSAANIDGALTAVLNTQYQSITVEWDGTQYWIE